MEFDICKNRFSARGGIFKPLTFNYLPIEISGVCSKGEECRQSKSGQMQPYPLYLKGPGYPEPSKRSPRGFLQLRTNQFTNFPRLPVPIKKPSRPTPLPHQVPTPDHDPSPPAPLAQASELCSQGPAWPPAPTPGPPEPARMSSAPSGLVLFLFAPQHMVFTSQGSILWPISAFLSGHWQELGALRGGPGHVLVPDTISSTKSQGNWALSLFGH